MRTLVLAALCLVFMPHIQAQQNALAPHSMYEPPMAAAAASMAASTAKSPADLLTTGEKTAWRQTGLYAEWPV